jgi:hypothetical protein
MITIAYPRKKLMFGTILALAVASVGLLVWTFIQKSGEVTIARSHWVTDLSDDRKLVGLAESVFFGQVVGELGQTEEFGHPETQFRVKVLEVLKGSVAGVATVNQQGGYQKEDNSQFRMEGDPQLLELGKSYLFVTRPLQEKGWHTLVPGYGDIEVRVPKHAPDDAVLGSQHAGELRQRFTAAIARQIPFNPKNP